MLQQRFGLPKTQRQASHLSVCLCPPCKTTRSSLCLRLNNNHRTSWPCTVVHLNTRYLSSFHNRSQLFLLFNVNCSCKALVGSLVTLMTICLEQHGYVRNREVIAIVAGTRTKSGSTNFLRLHVLGEHNQEGVRFFAPHEDEVTPAPDAAHAPPAAKAKRAAKTVKGVAKHR